MQLPFNLDVYHDRVARVRTRFGADDLAGIVVTLPDSLHWLTGYDTIGYLWTQALVVAADGDPLLVTRTSEEPGFRETSWLEHGRFYDIATEDNVAVIADELRARGLDRGRVGIELQAFTFLPHQWDKLKSLLPDVEWVDTTWLVAEERLIKSPQELFYQRQAAEIADYALQAGIDACWPGVSELQVGGIMAKALGDGGSEYGAIPPQVTSGPRSALVHGMGTRRTIARGDVVTLEIGASVNRYHAIVMRTVVVGHPSRRVTAVADCLQRGLAAAVAAAVPGAAPEAADDACNAVLAEQDLVRRRCHRIGYSIGVAYPPGWLEPMTLVAGDSHRLEPGISFSLEPNLALQDEGFGMKLGETYECTEAGAESMSALSPELIVNV